MFVIAEGRRRHRAIVKSCAVLRRAVIGNVFDVVLEKSFLKKIIEIDEVRGISLTVRQCRRDKNRNTPLRYDVTVRTRLRISAKTLRVP